MPILIKQTMERIMAERSGTSSQKRESYSNTYLLYVERFSNVFARCGKIPGRTYINFKQGPLKIWTEQFRDNKLEGELQVPFG